MYLAKLLRLHTAVVLLIVGATSYGVCESQPIEETTKEAITMSQLSDYPYESRYVTVKGARMHYIEKGEGDPVLFIHGQPTWSYTWRNVLPYVSARGRAIAVDLIGMGMSDKPNLEYAYGDHFGYLEGFIEALGLRNVTLVGHDWGSVLAFDYATRHESNVKGLVFLEALIPPAFPLPSLEALPEPAREMFAGFRDPRKGRKLLIEQNMFIEQMLPNMVVRSLTEAEMDAYRLPFLDPASREPVYRWPNELPIGGQPQHMHALFEQLGQWLVESSLPKLHLYASPGAANPAEVVSWVTENFKNTESVYVGEGIHFIQEDQPEGIGRAIAEWLRRQNFAASAAGKPQAFVVAHSTILDPEAFQEYARQAGGTLAEFGGTVLLKGKTSDVLAGDHGHKTVGVLGFPSSEHAWKWYHSSRYQELIELRDRAAEMTVVVYSE